MKKAFFTLSAAFFAAAFIFSGCASTGKNESLCETSSVYLTFDDESDLLKDFSGKNSVVTAASSVFAAEGRESSALLFDGESQFLELPSDILSEDQLTLAMWVKPEKWSYWMRLFDIGSNDNVDVWCGMDKPTKALRLSVGNVSIYAPIPKEGEWTHVIASFGNGSAALYVNGKLSQSIKTPLTAKEVGKTAKGLYVGKSNWNDPLFYGAVDSLTVLKHRVTDKEAELLFKKK
ncbi:MAG: LamG domain-containing protein [Spirochaetia bacterium]|nr:LamG domain-containing protein [Spirochaetia bacterium]